MTRRGKYTLYALILAALAAMAIFDYVRQPKDYPMGTNIRDFDAAAVTETIVKDKKLSDASQLYVDDEYPSFPIDLTKDFDWDPMGAGTIRFVYAKNGSYKTAQLRLFPESEKFSVNKSGSWHEPASLYHLRDFLEALQYLPQDEIRALQPDAGKYQLWLAIDGTPEDSNRSITYSPDGVTTLDGWYIHLTIYPQHAAKDENGTSGYVGYPEEAIELFYRRP